MQKEKGKKKRRKKKKKRGSKKNKNAHFCAELSTAFMQNFHTNQAPRPPGPRRHHVAFWGFVSPGTKYPLVDMAADAGMVRRLDPRPRARRARGPVALELRGAARTYDVDEMAAGGGDRGPLQARASGGGGGVRGVPGGERTTY